MDRYTKVGRGRINGELCDVAIDNDWKVVEVTAFSFLVRGSRKNFYVDLSGHRNMFSVVGSDCLVEMFGQGVIDQDAYRAAIAAHVERLL